MIFGISRTMLFVIYWSTVRSIMTLESNEYCSVPIEDTSNFKYMSTKVPFEAGDYLIFRPKVDRWVDFTQYDYGGLRYFPYREFVKLKKCLIKNVTSHIVFSSDDNSLLKASFFSKIFMIISNPNMVGTIWNLLFLLNFSHITNCR